MFRSTGGTTWGWLVGRIAIRSIGVAVLAVLLSMQVAPTAMAHGPAKAATAVEPGLSPVIGKGAKPHCHVGDAGLGCSTAGSLLLGDRVLFMLDAGSPARRIEPFLMRDHILGPPPHPPPVLSV